jgi:uncharacterized membrane protein YGL010W
MSELYKKYFTFYEQFHTHKYNKLVHIACIPGIVWSLFGLVNHTVSKVVDLPNSVFTMPSNLIYIAYMIYYHKLGAPQKILDKTVLFYALVLYNSSKFYLTTSQKYSLYIFAAVQVLSWVFQILSHKIIEKNSPALLSGIKQSVLTAPIFVIEELNRYIPDIRVWYIALFFGGYITF